MFFHVLPVAAFAGWDTKFMEVFLEARSDKGGNFQIPPGFTWGTTEF